jgi:hypothetical protein
VQAGYQPVRAEFGPAILSAAKESRAGLDEIAGLDVAQHGRKLERAADVVDSSTMRLGFCGKKSASKP